MSPQEFSFARLMREIEAISLPLTSFHFLPKLLHHSLISIDNVNAAASTCSDKNIKPSCWLENGMEGNGSDVS